MYQSPSLFLLRFKNERITFSNCLCKHLWLWCHVWKIDRWLVQLFTILSKVKKTIESHSCETRGTPRKLLMGDKKKNFVIPPNSNPFSDWRRTCHVSWVKTHWLQRVNKTHELPGETTNEFLDSRVISAFSLKPRQVCKPVGVNRTISSHFFSISELGSVTKQLMPGPAVNSEFCFPSTSMFPSASSQRYGGSQGNKTHCIPAS